jgi:hypothetical protein
MQHGHLDKTKVLKTQGDSMSDVRKPNSKSVLKSIIPVRLVLYTGQTGVERQSDRLDLSKSMPGAPSLSGPFIGFQSRLLDMPDIGLN